MRALGCLFTLILSVLMLAALPAAAQDKQEVDLALRQIGAVHCAKVRFLNGITE